MTATTAGLFFTSLLLGLILIPLCFVQLLYLEASRLRHRELPALEYFKNSLESKIGMPAHQGALGFSLWKHFILLGMAIVNFAAIESSGLRMLAADRPLWQVMLEATAISCAAMVMVAHFLPHVLYRRTSGHWLAPFMPAIRLAALGMRPLLALLSFVSTLAEIGNTEEELEEKNGGSEDIEALISAGAEEGLIQEEDRELIQSVVEFGDKTVREVMTPRPQMVTISRDATLEQLRELVVREQYSRIPVTGASIDDVVGFVHVRDVFEQDFEGRSNRKVSDLMRQIAMVPETKPVEETLRLMQKKGVHMVIVVDEYGQTAGLATMEDLVEEIVGEIRDEHEPDQDVERDESGGYTVSGNLDVGRLRELLDFRPEDGIESTTIGGLVTEWLGHVPHAGENVERDGIKIEVLAADGRRVSQVRMSRT